MIEEMFGGPAAGRHALDEDAVQTPIFHALKRGGWRQRQQERTVDSVEEFRRDPLTAPIPIQALAPAPARERSAPDWSREWSPSMPAHEQPRDRSARDWAQERSARDGSWERSAPDWAQDRLARDWAQERSARDRSWERSAALAGQGRHHREPVPALW